MISSGCGSLSSLARCAFIDIWGGKGKDSLKLLMRGRITARKKTYDSDLSMSRSMATYFRTGVQFPTAPPFLTFSNRF